jgi:amidophosphoribosyltransferase
VAASPAVRYPNVYGIDMPAASELVASQRTDEEVRELIGADWLIYQDLEDLIGSVQYDNANIDEFDTSCFSGRYVTDDVTKDYLRRLESQRSDSAKNSREARRRQIEGAVEDGDDEGDDSPTGAHAGVA